MSGSLATGRRDTRFRLVRNWHVHHVACLILIQRNAAFNLWTLPSLFGCGNNRNVYFLL